MLSLSPPGICICLLQRMICSIIIIVLFVSTTGEAKMKLPDGVVIPAIIGFGDSIIDQGMNNYISTVVKCDFPPYGQDFSGGIPTGRFSNAKTPPDLIAEELGIKELVPAYLDPNLQPEDLKTGVSFASGASGYDPQTSAIASVIPLPQQLKYFKEYVGKLKRAYGENETKFITDNSLFLVVAGSDDIANTYFTIGLRRLQYDVNSYSHLLLHSASTFIQELYEVGARRIGVFGLPPIGCVPSQRTLGGGENRDCSKEANEAAKLVNSEFSAEIHSLSKTLPNAKLVFLDIYQPLLHIIQNPKQYGLEVVDKGCCGTGEIEVSILCNKLSKTCADHNKYLFWDSYHPTEKGYKILVNELLNKYMDRFY